MPQSLSIFGLFLLFCCALIPLERPYAAKPKDPDLAMTEYMRGMAQQLGLECIDCHNTKNFKDPSKTNYKIAKEHIAITAKINEMNLLKGKKVTCYVCHQGKSKFTYEKEWKIGD